RPDFKTILVDFADWSTLSGLKHIISTTRNVFRVAWTAIFLLLCAVFAYFLYLSITTYLSYPSQYATQIIFEEPIFPRVSLCNLNAFKYLEMPTQPAFGALYAMQESYRLTKQGKTVTTDVYGFQTMDRFEMYNNARLAHMVLSSQMSESDRGKLAYDYSDIITECTFMGIACSSSDFIPFFHPEFGRCFTFASNRSVTRVGALNQLRLLLTTNAYQSRGLKWANLPTTERVGFKVAVHTADQYPDIDRYGVNVSPGQQTAIGVNQFRMERLDKPYGRCTINQTADDNFYSSYEYSIGSCLDTCRQQFTVEKCSCAHPIWRKADNDSYCSTVPQYKCLISLRGDQTKSNATDRNLNAIRDCECYDPCVETRITMTVSLSSYPAIQYSVGTGTNSQFSKLYEEQGGGRDTTTTTTTSAPGVDPDNEIGCLSNLNTTIRDDVLYATDSFNLLRICNGDPICKVKITPATGGLKWHQNWPCYYKKCSRPDAATRKGQFECKDVLPNINFVPNSKDVPGWPGWEKGDEPPTLLGCLDSDPAPAADNSCSKTGIYMTVILVRWKLWVWKVGLSNALGRKKRAVDDGGLSANIKVSTTASPANTTSVDNPGLGSCDTWNMNFDSVEECNSWYQKNGLILQVYVDSLQYTKWTQGATLSLLNVLIEIGGNAGLWLGISFISCLELIGLVGIVFYQCLTCRRRKRETQLNDERNQRKRRDSLSD
ncbi:hypothetical protein PFISCL1PPCAC_21819, partial [Pristionchus fissidentatus]